MLNNDVLRSIRYMLDLSEPRVAQIFALGGGTEPDRDELQALLLKEGESGFEALGNPRLLQFLDGLIVARRGRDDSRPARPPEKRLTNNVVLKKLRVAFELKDADLHAILEAAGMPISRPEMSALFRQGEHKNFRLCGDQLLRAFLKGLTLRLRPEVG